MSKYHIITFGCQMNKNDSQRIAFILEKCGLKKAPSEKEADLIVVNMCSVRQSAVDRAFSKIKSLKSKKKNCQLIVAGCILAKDKEKMKTIANEIVEVKELENFPKILKKLGLKIKSFKIKDYLEVQPKYEKNPVAYVPIMTGCNNFCAYCVVPFTRGLERCRHPEEILCEIKNWLKKGAKEIWLLGQNVNSYKFKTKKSKIITFAQLLKMVNKIPGKFWIRFTSSHPKDLKDDLIETIAKCQKITPYLNLPLQSGDDKILKKMNRPYTSKDYQKLIEKLKKAFKKYRKGQEAEIAISTDIIVGFPQETKKAFENTKKLVKKMGFFMAYIAQYSPRPGTLAFSLKDNVPLKEKQKREKELTQIIKKSGQKFNQKFVGKIVEVLVLKEKKGFYFGKTRHYQTIKFPKTKEKLVGCFVKVKVKKALDFGLEGDLFKFSH